MSWIASLFRRRQIDRDLADEIEQHLLEKTDELIAAGMPREEAAFAARRQFGNAALIEERGREVWRWEAIEGFFSDVRYAFRQIRHSPSFSAAAILTLALGIGANTAVFSVVNAVLLRPLPFAEPDRLVAFESMDMRGGPHPDSLSYPNFFDFRRGNNVFERLVCYRDDEVTITGQRTALHLTGEIVSWDLFQMLRVQPVIGRAFVPEDEKAGAHVAVLSHQVWLEQFGGNPAVIGRALVLDGRPYTAIGVAPPGFNFPVGSRRVQIWTTLARDAAAEAASTPITEQRGARLLNVTARLKPDVSPEQAQAQMDSVAGALARQYPDENKNYPRTYVRPELTRMVGDTREAMFVLLGAVGLLLLIACANVASLLLARTAEREREFAVRLAIGAARRRVVRQLLTENLVLALLGCAAGVLAAFGAIRIGLPFASDAVPRILEASLDSHVLGFSIALALVTSVLFSISPALRIGRMDFDGSLKGGSRTSTDHQDRLRGTLMVGQIALGLVLLSGAVVFAAVFVSMLRRDPGFRPDHLLTFNVNLPSAKYDVPAQIAWYARLLDRLEQLPGVVSVAGGLPLPLTGSQINVSFDIQERPAPVSARPRSDMAIVTPGYFRTIGTPLIRGRDFTDHDDEKAAPVLIVNEAFARKFFPGEDVLGKRIRSGAGGRMGNPMREIVGVVGNAKQRPLSPNDDPIYYFPYRQLAWGAPPVVLRTQLPPLALESSVRAVVASLDEEVPVYEVQTFDELASLAIAPPRFQMLLLGSFAGIGLLLTAVGLYGVLAYSVARRTREIGIRMALGADRTAILAMVFARASKLVLTGVALGLGGAFASDRVLRELLYGIAPSRPLLLGLACAIVGLTATLAAYLPARRAASIAPVEALRTE